MDALQQFGLRFIAGLQHAVPGLDAPMRFFTFLGREQLFQMLIPLLYWCVDSTIGMRLAVLVLLNAEVNAWFKWAFHGPRPYWLDPALGRDTETSYGVPSGHAQSAVAIWMYLASCVRRAWAWAAAAALVLLISLSRLYLGVHFPHDIVVGWLLGAVVVFLFLRVAARAEGWLAGRPAWALAGASAGASAVLVVMPAFLLATRVGIGDAPSWAAFAARARQTEGSVSAAGMLLGAVLGFGLQARLVRFDACGPLGKRVARFVVGLAGMAALLFGLGAVFPHGGSALALALRFARYFLLIFWAALLAPWLFVRLGLAAARPAQGVGTA